MTDAVAAPYLKLLSVGLLWMSVHCVGMCGPIVAGFDLASRRKSLSSAAVGILRFQAGKAVAYASFGMVAGFFGATLNRIWSDSASVVACVAGAAMLVVVVHKSVRLLLRNVKAPWPLNSSSTSSREPDASQPIPSPLVQLQRPKSVGRSIRERLVRLPAEGIGAAMAFLPCLIPAWVLALAAATGSPIHGALLMLLLVALNTPILLVAHLIGSVARKVQPIALGLQAVSGVWLVLVGLAALDVIAHRSAGFSAFGRSFMVMLY